MAQKAIGKIYDQTSGVGALLSTSFNTLENIDALIVYTIAAGAAAPTGGLVATAGDLKDAGVAATYYTYPAVGIAGSRVDVVGPGGLADASILPAKLSFAITAGAASTVRLIIYAVRMI